MRSSIKPFPREDFLFIYKQPSWPPQNNDAIAFYQDGTYVCQSHPKDHFFWRWNADKCTVEAYNKSGKVWDDVRDLREEGVNDCYRAWVAEQIVSIY